MSHDTLSIQFALSRPGFSLDVSLDVPMRGVTGLFGASGAGKTTLLRCIAGLERPESGRLVVAGETWQDDEAQVSRPVHARDIGYVFQEPRLFSMAGNARPRMAAGLSSTQSSSCSDCRVCLIDRLRDCRGAKRSASRSRVHYCVRRVLS
jgi:ABC-type molybdate transport system ATPase subunit